MTSQHGRSCAIPANVSNQHDVRRMFEQAQTELGPLAGFINNAGITVASGRLDALTLDVLTRGGGADLGGVRHRHPNKAP